MKEMKIPDRFKRTIYVYAYSDPTSSLYGMIEVSLIGPIKNDDRVILASVDVDIPLDSTGFIDDQVGQLQASKRNIIDGANAKAGQIDAAIESLLAANKGGAK